MTAHRKRNSGKVNIILIAVILVCIVAVGLGALLVSEYRGMWKKKTTAPEELPAPVEAVTPAPTASPVPTSEPTPTPVPTPSPEEIAAQEEAARKEAAARKAEAAKYSFYQKLEKGYGTNILILGDASAMDKQNEDAGGIVDGPVFRGLSERLEEKYPVTMGGQVSIHNLANANGNLLCDALRVKELPEEPSYDLAILSYGINDQKSDVTSDYEALLISLHRKYPDCSIICTIEPCFHGMTPALETMVKISEAYGVPVINLFSVLYEKGADTYFSYFEENQILLNEKGTEEWIERICEIIDSNVASSTGKMADTPVIEKKAENITKLCFIPVADPRVSRADDTSYALDFKADGLSYIRHNEMLGKDDAKVIADEILYSLGKKPNGSATPEGGYITPVYDRFICEKDCTVIFTTKELADGLQGFYLTEKTTEK